MNQRLAEHLRVFAVAVLLLLGASAYLTWSASQTFEKKIQPALEAKSIAIGRSVNGVIRKALRFGVPFDQLRDMDAFLASALAEETHRELAYLAVTDATGTMRYAGTRMLKRAALRTILAQAPSETQTAGGYNDHTVPILLQGTCVGTLHVGVRRSFVRDRMLDILYDNLTVVLVSLLMTFELLTFLLNHGLRRPLETVRRMLHAAALGDGELTEPPRGRDELGLLGQTVLRLAVRRGRLSREALDVEALEDAAQAREHRLYLIRPPLFLFVFAEALSMSFFPMYVARVCGTDDKMIIGLPISVFMLCWGLSQPFCGVWSDRVGRRAALIAGTCMTAAGLILTGLAQGLADLLVYRALAGIGYGMVFITCTAYVTEHSRPETRTRGMAMFLATFFAGSLCGASTGGILADRIGYAPVFFLAGGFALLATLFSRIFLEPGRNIDPKPLAQTQPAAPAPRQRGLSLLARNIRFLALTFLVAIPAKICLTGFMYYTAPLYLKEAMHETQSSIGRVLMAYGLVMIFAAPVVGRLADRFGNRQRFVQIGSVIAGLGLMITFFWQSFTGVLVSIALLGLAHAIGVSSQLALIPDICRRESETVGHGTVMGIFRLIERSGSIIGPLLAGLLIAAFGFAPTFLGIGVLTLAGIFLFTLILFLTGGGDESADEQGAPS